MNFNQAYEKWYESYSRTVSDYTASEVDRKMTELVLPIFQDKNINNIKPSEILGLCDKVAEDSTYYAKRIVADIARVYNYAVVVLETTEKNPATAVIEGGYLPSHTTKGFAFVDIKDVSTMLRKIDYETTKSRPATNAFWTIVYSGLRCCEVVNAKKSEFDFENLLWKIPAERMKISENGEHIVPLSIQLAMMLQQHFNSNDSEFAFYSARTKKAIATVSPYHILQKCGYVGKQTLHGFRKIFSTHAHNNGWSIDSIERSLHHEIKGVRGVYNHANMLNERVELMQWYADEVDRWRGI